MRRRSTPLLVRPWNSTETEQTVTGGPRPSICTSFFDACMLSRKDGNLNSPPPPRLSRRLAFSMMQDETCVREERRDGMQGERRALTAQILQGLGLRYAAPVAPPSPLRTQDICITPLSLPQPLLHYSVPR